MTIEQRVFENMRFDPQKMRAYGFVCEKDRSILKQDFMGGDFTAEITVYDNTCDGGEEDKICGAAMSVRGIVIDNMNDEEYAPLRIETFSGAYVNSVRAAYEDLLNDIAGQCCTAIDPDAERRAEKERLIRRVLEIADSIPEGHVASYGQIAEMAGRPKNARLVGRIMSMADRYGDHPCHRVVNHAGRTVPGWREQRSMLEAEGVEFKPNGCVDMKKYQLKKSRSIDLMQ